MAANLVKTPFRRVIQTRTFSSQQPSPIGGIINYEVKTSVLPNKLVVASADNQSPISRVAVVVRAGPRNETPDNSGVAHVLRVCAGLSTKNASQFAITRNIQQVGAALNVSSTRETITYTLEGTRSAVEKVAPFLADVVGQQEFRPWEVSDQTPRLRLELALRPLQFRAVDLLHKAAFRQGLGNSLFISKHQLGKISTETLQHYCSSHFVTGRTAVVGLGVDHRQLAEFAQSLNLAESSGDPAASPYKGGEIRSDKGGDLAFIAIGGEGASLKDTKQMLAFATLQCALGTGPQVKWAYSDNGLLAKNVGQQQFNDHFAVSALNATYSDTGLFGVVIAAPSAVAGKVVEGVVKTIKCGSVTDADLKRGQNQLKVALLSDAEDGSKAIECLGTQAALLGAAQSPCEMAAAIDSVSVSDLNAALKKVAKKISIASVGNLRTVPFLDELK